MTATIIPFPKKNAALTDSKFYSTEMLHFPSDVALHGKGPTGLMADTHQAFHIGVPMDARAEWEVPDTGLGEFEYGHGKYSPEYSVCD